MYFLNIKLDLYEKQIPNGCNEGKMRLTYMIFGQMFLHLKATVSILRIGVIFFYNNLGFSQAEQVILISGIKMLKISL